MNEWSGLKKVPPYWPCGSRFCLSCAARYAQKMNKWYYKLWRKIKSLVNY